MSSITPTSADSLSTETPPPPAAQTAQASHSLPTLGEAFRVWLKVASLSFGGPAGQIAVMHRILVEEKRWISEERFLHALNYCMLLPGPEAQQLATYVGWLMHRTLGGIMAGGLFVLPGIIAIMALSYIYAGYGNVPLIVALFFGLKAAVLAIVLEAVFRVGKRALKNSVMVALAAAAFVGIFFLNIPFPIIILAAALIGFVGAWSGAAVFQVSAGHGNGKKEQHAIVDSLLGDAAARAHAAERCARRAGRDGLADALAGTGDRARRHARKRQRLQRDRDLLQQDGDGDVRRRLRGARLCRPAGGRELRLAQARRDARRPRHGRNHARPADHGAAIRGLHGGVSRSQWHCLRCWRERSAGCSPPG